MWQCCFEVVCDVTTPLTGRDCASTVPFSARKKGRRWLLDRALAHYTAIIQRALDIDVLHIPGGGAASRS